MKKYSLVLIGRDCFIMLNADKPLLNKECNSTIFQNKSDANKNVSVFEHFEVPFDTLSEPLDRRTKKFKDLVKRFGYFSAAFLPEIKERYLKISATYIKGSYHLNRI